MENIDKLQNRIGYRFKNPALLKEALSHSSYTNEMKINKLECNERLEFLGDAVLELISSEFLFFEHRDKAEGDLSKVRASLVCEKALAYCARLLELGDNIFLGRGKKQMGGDKRDSILSDALEALIGAIYLDSGFKEAERFVKEFILKDMEEKRIFVDSKTVIQEIAHEKYHGKVVPEYSVVDTEGPEHNRIFHVQLRLGDIVTAEGTGRNKKDAEQAAAYTAILKIRGMRS